MYLLIEYGITINLNHSFPVMWWSNFKATELINESAVLQQPSHNCDTIKYL